VTDAEIVDGIKLLARTEGIFTEPAAARPSRSRRSSSSRAHPADESIVISVTGNGYKTLEAVLDTVEAASAYPRRSRLRRALCALADARARRSGLTQDRGTTKATGNLQGGPDIMAQVRIPTPLRKYSRRR
jgi:threonine synthase